MNVWTFQFLQFGRDSYKKRNQTMWNLPLSGAAHTWCEPTKSPSETCVLSPLLHNEGWGHAHQLHTPDFTTTRHRGSTESETTDWWWRHPRVGSLFSQHHMARPDGSMAPLTQASSMHLLLEQVLALLSCQARGRMQKLSLFGDFSYASCPCC